MPRFVVLQHEMPPELGRPSHWDFMLEAGEVLWTWALPCPPRAGESLDAERLADHRPAYLEYEGAISDGRGRVTRWDEGSYEVERLTDGELLIVLQGRRCSGPVRLTQYASNAQRWRFEVEPAT